MLTRDEFLTLYKRGPDALWSEFEALQTKLLAQQEQMDALLLRLKQLEDRLGKDSHNSSKPPSSDGLKKKPVSLRQPTGRKPGAQKGHPGKTLQFADTPDHVVVHSPACCSGCGASLKDVAPSGSERRQVHDLPPLRVLVTEHTSEHKCCPACGLYNRGVFPADVPAAVQYGARIKGLGVYLLDYQLLPYQRIARLFADLFGAPLSSGVLFEAQQMASNRLEPVVARIRETLGAAPVVHFDETGFRVEALLHWLHSASTPTLTAYSWHKKRGREGMDAGGVLPTFTGTAVHDGYASYQQYGCSHALCNAHHLRELTALYEQEGAEWAKEMRHLLAHIKRTVDRAKEAGKTRLPVLDEARLEGRYRKLIKRGLGAHPPASPIRGKRGKRKQSPARNLLDRLQRHEAQVLAFLHDFRVPFDNNQAERDIRMMKLQQKISGCFRSTTGVEAFCRIRSYICTLQKQGINVLSALEHVFRGAPIYPALA